MSFSIMSSLCSGGWGGHLATTEHFVVRGSASVWCSVWGFFIFQFFMSRRGSRLWRGTPRGSTLHFLLIALHVILLEHAVQARSTMKPLFSLPDSGLWDHVSNYSLLSERFGGHAYLSEIYPYVLFVGLRDTLKSLISDQQGLIPMGRGPPEQHQPLSLAR